MYAQAQPTVYAQEQQQIDIQSEEREEMTTEDKVFHLLSVPDNKMVEETLLMQAEM